MNPHDERMEAAARGIDTLNHSSVQPWSAGDIFPATIARIEKYRPAAYHEQAANGAMDSLEARREWTAWELTLDGHSEVYATYDDAHAVAEHLLKSPAGRRLWNGCAKPERYPSNEQRGDPHADAYGVV